MSRLLRRAAVVTATAALALSLSAVPANAEEMLVVVTYYDANWTIVGQKWFGCSYDPDGDSWGTLEGRTKIHLTPCQF